MREKCSVNRANCTLQRNTSNLLKGHSGVYYVSPFFREPARFQAALNRRNGTDCRTQYFSQPLENAMIPGNRKLSCKFKSRASIFLHAINFSCRYYNVRVICLTRPLAALLKSSGNVYLFGECISDE